MKKTRGYSLVELMVAVGIITVMSTLSIVSFTQYLKRENLSSASSALANALRDARSRTLASVNGKEYGVHIEADRFTLFSGKVFNTTLSDEPYVFSSGLKASSTIQDVVFSRVTGNSSASGTIDMYIVGAPGAKKSVGIQGTGLVTLF